MNFSEQACSFDCHGDRLYGILSLPETAQARGVLIVVGGPQYRAGSHRQFVLLARALAAQGIPAMRFDYRGMGDSEGEARGFEEIDDDIRCAIDHFMRSVPGMREVALWGLCDAASAALFYAHRDRRVSGLALINPWVRTEAGLARTHLRHYYGTRLLDPRLWKKIASGRFNYAAAGQSLLAAIRLAGARGQHPFQRPAGAMQLEQSASAALPLPERMLDAYGRFGGEVLIILSGNDFTAREFLDLTAASAPWRHLLAGARTRRCELPGANHTFSTSAWREQVAAWTAEWLRKMD